MAFAHRDFDVRKRAFFRFCDQRGLVLAKLTPSRYEEISRAKLLPTIEHTRSRDVLWCHPAFANRRASRHNGQELLGVSLAATNAKMTVAPEAPMILAGGKTVLGRTHR